MYGKITKKVQTWLGFEVWWNGQLMLIKMQKWTLLLAFLLSVVANIVLARFLFEDDFALLGKYILSVPKATLGFGTIEGVYKGNAYALPSDKFVAIAKPIVMDFLPKLFFTGLIVTIGSIWLMLRTSAKYFGGIAENKMKTEVVRGSEIIPINDLNAELAAANETPGMLIGETAQPYRLENHGCMIAMKPGGGKTQICRRILKSAARRKERVIVYSAKADDYFMPFYNPARGDVLFNGADERCLKWCVFNEIRYTSDIMRFATSFIPIPPDIREPYFHKGSQQLFAAGMTWCIANNQKTNKALYDVLMLTLPEMRELFTGVPGCEGALKYCKKNDEGSDVTSTLQQYVDSLKYLADIDGDFCIQTWLESDGEGWLFLPSNDRVKDAIAPLISLFLDLLARGVRELRDDERRLVFMLDEFPTLPRLMSLPELLSLCRAKGASVYLCLQSYPQLLQTYGQNLAETLVGLCGTYVIGALGDNASAEYFSKIIGVQEINEKSGGISYGPQAFRDGGSIQERVRDQRVVSPDQLKNLPLLEAFVKFHGYRWSHTKITPESYPANACDFIPSEALSLSSLAKTKSMSACTGNGALRTHEQVLGPLVSEKSCDALI